MMAQWSGDQSVEPVALGLLTDEGDKDDLNGEQGVDLLVASAARS